MTSQSVFKYRFNLLILGFAMFVCSLNPAQAKGLDIQATKPSGYPVAVFGGGCFWCVEIEFRRLPGVLYTRSGYTGGALENPKYEDTHDGKSGHAEAVEITYDPAKISYKDLVEFFFTQAHDPTELNRQGPDVGTQYRSALFYANDKEKEIAQTVIADLEKRKLYDKPIVTTLEPLGQFWEAEGYHQQYYDKYKDKTGQTHPNQTYHEERLRQMHK